MAIDQFTDNSTCQSLGACILPQDDPSQAHSVLWYNLTQSLCESSSIGVSKSIDISHLTTKKCSGGCGTICISTNNNGDQCQSLPLDLCMACQYGLASCPAPDASCQISQKECDSQLECEAYGYCSGQEPLLDVLFPEDARYYPLVETVLDISRLA
jgi:hypothetical protein